MIGKVKVEDFTPKFVDLEAYMKNLLAARSSTFRKESRPTLSKPIVKSSFAFPSGAIADEVARTIATKPVEIVIE